jgi:molybdate transport system regulatory protein
MSDLAKFLRSTTLRTSARTQFRGQIKKIIRGGVNTEVELELSDSATIIALITNDSVKKMGLKKGYYAIALVKSSLIILSKDKNLATSARNKLEGKVSKISKGNINSEVALDLGNQKTLTSIITNKSVKELALKKDDLAFALFKASSVILMTD